MLKPQLTAVSRREVVRRGVSSSSDSLESADGRGANMTHTACIDEEMEAHRHLDVATRVHLMGGPTFVMCGEMDLMACAGPTAPAASRIGHNKPP